jgi:hypothetical protein
MFPAPTFPHSPLRPGPPNLPQTLAARAQFGIEELYYIGSHVSSADDVAQVQQIFKSAIEGSGTVALLDLQISTPAVSNAMSVLWTCVAVVSHANLDTLRFRLESSVFDSSLMAAAQSAGGTHADSTYAYQDDIVITETQFLFP